VTTNGGAFGNEKVVDWTVAAKPFNINISIDSKDAGVHDYSRGIDGSLSSIVAGSVLAVSTPPPRKKTYALG